ncbi:hypothetical protein ELH88_37585 [Rhizobium ruizarguesonis]|uniref:hypothetical protein n=1 Tax=Rhizobium TaxID=379 RepID=UPI00102FDDE8|nr:MULTISPECIES: hypothetical protein [Rhizobium]MBY5406630.1 hypothetical protein [Rhizobium leguminosarum]MBY5482759.1 hypothetical protein [Rhizobium leguminosarum]TAW70011.1 hypothetical protein ELI11_35950 [Rhizobium ruizarguesonis]TAY27814.1 hypothetical protein ELH87_37955 [Rhizobium ruizarguesonis]TAY41261.1 hypothetical protein ELH88_37585 [Rhizobium ruizarguesonis]
MAKRPDTRVIAAAIALLAGTAGGYAISELARTGHIADLEKEIVRLKESAQQPLPVDAPSDEEASAAIAKSGRSIRISECKPREAIPGVTCTGIITTTSGTFAGSAQSGVLSFARIDGAWAQIQ